MTTTTPSFASTCASEKNKFPEHNWSDGSYSKDRGIKFKIYTLKTTDSAYPIMETENTYPNTLPR